MPVVSIRHLTTYRYRNPVAFGEHRMMFRPLESFDQRLISAEVGITPDPALLRHIHDVGGACVGVARFQGRSEILSFESRVRVDHQPQVAFDLEGEEGAIGQPPFSYSADEVADLARSIARRHPDEDGAVAAWARRFLRPMGRTRLSALLSDMAQSIRQDFKYAVRLEGAPQSPAATLSLRRGSCRDFALLMIEAARSLGLAAQFVSGYVYSSSAKAGRAGGGHTHAWVRVYLPACGWVDFDPTNGIVGNIDLIRVAVVNDPRQALPLHGTWAGLPSDYLGMDVTVQVGVEADVVAQPARPMRVAQGR
ncbi:MAG: transglutaminase family protein [Phenylobacterium sp.]